ncbi:MAG: TolC family protein [Phycisphaeraceae bacterium]|nr:TolC family protein [Phycisphaeraceae bacterium]
MSRTTVAALIGLFVVVIPGCLVGPNYERPVIDMPSSYRPPAALRTSPAEAPLDEWWLCFKDPTLNALVARAESGSLTLQQAAANVQVYRARYGITYSELFPSISLGASYSRSRVNFASLGGAEGTNSPFNDWQYGLALSTWEIDLFGKIRRAMQARQAELQATVEQYRQALVSLRAEVAIAYLTVRTLQAQLRYTRESVELLSQVVRITEAKFAAQTTSLIDLSQVKAQLATSQARIPVLESQIIAQSNGLSLLLGEMPGPVADELAEPAPIPLPNDELLLGIPMDLLRRRADVLEAERRLVAAVARIGVAEAGFLPELTIMGVWGIDSTTFSGLGDWGNRTYTFGPRITWNFFNAGRVVSQVQEAQAQQLIDELGYRQVVLKAVSEVETSLTNYDGTRRAMRDFETGLTDVTRAYELAVTRYRAGTIDLTQLLQFAQVVLQAQDGLAQATGQTALNLVEIYRSLGGGWERDAIPFGGADAFGPDGTPPDGRDFPPQRPKDQPPQETTSSS